MFFVRKGSRELVGTLQRDAPEGRAGRGSVPEIGRATRVLQAHAHGTSRSNRRHPEIHAATIGENPCLIVFPAISFRETL